MRIGLKRKLLLAIVTTVACLLLFAVPAFGQCAMCRAALAGSGNPLFVRNFNIGVLVLLVPPVTIFCSIFVVLRRYRAADEEDKNKDDDA